MKFEIDFIYVMGKSEWSNGLNIVGSNNSIDTFQQLLPT